MGEPHFLFTFCPPSKTAETIQTADVPMQLKQEVTLTKAVLQFASFDTRERSNPGRYMGFWDFHFSHPQSSLDGDLVGFTAYIPR